MVPGAASSAPVHSVWMESMAMMPGTRRGGGASSVLRSSRANLRPFTRRVAPAPMGGGAPSSTIVFQPPQASHLPDHLAWEPPQDWQTKEEFLAMSPYEYKKRTQMAIGQTEDHCGAGLPQ